ncbi:GntR family transcriptional regulator [Microbacterium sp. X-17]|uniref:GntR family transcriptional regulator n=1 Tax=Microbacterium sp. X-17 TaxID=3144404 RepID=UPI0031F48CBE
MANVRERDSGQVQHEPLVDFISRSLVRSISSGEIAAGERLSPAFLAKQLGVSHIPVRESLTSLEASGYVRRVPRVGFFVTEVSIQQVEETYRLRQVLEDEAIRVAMPLLTDEDVERMRDLNARAGKAMATRSGSFLDLNREFHFVAFERTGNETLLRFLNQLWDASRRFQSTMLYDPLPPEVLHHQHEGLVEAFEARDVELATARMTEHRDYTLNALRSGRI